MHYKTFKNLNIITILLLVIFLVWNANWLSFFILFLIHGAISYWGTTQISSQFHLRSYCKAKQLKNKQIALSFDDSVRSPAQTKQVLDILKKYQTTATFFCIGKQLETAEQQASLKRIDQEGHLIGNHSYSHSNWFDFYSSKKVVAELNKTDNRIKNIIGKKPLFFRPPYGITNPNIAKAIKSTQHYVIGWSLRSLDTVIKDDEKLLKRVCAKLKNGDIVLFHDHLPQMTTFLPLFLEYLLNQGYTIVNLDKLLGIKPYQN